MFNVQYFVKLWTFRIICYILKGKNIDKFLGSIIKFSMPWLHGLLNTHIFSIFSFQEAFFEEAYFFQIYVSTKFELGNKLICKRNDKNKKKKWEKQWFTFSSKIFKIEKRKKPEALRTSYYQTFSCFPETNQFAVPWKARRKIEFSDVDWIIKWISSEKICHFYIL